MKLDFYIKNGHVLDPYTKKDEICDIGIIGNKIVDVPDYFECDKVIDAEGCFVFPGLIDFHTHIFHSGSNVSVRPDYLLSTGVTSTVDAGTAGPVNFESFYLNEISNSQIRIKSFLNVWGCGQLDFNIIENFDSTQFNANKIKKIVEKYKENILGLKIRMSEGVAKDKEALDFTIKLAEELNISVCVHVSKPLYLLSEMVGQLRKGDIFCHVYQNVGKDNIFDNEGEIKKEILEARKRGVIFDAANGKMNFNIEICKNAIKKNFLPDIISSDWLSDKYNYSAHAKSLTYILAKYLELGIPLMEVMEKVTSNPAKLMNMQDKIGTLKEGAYADIAIFKIINKEVKHLDFDNNEFTTNKLFVPQMVFSNGEIAFCQADFALI